MRLTIELHDPVGVLFRELEGPITQSSVAITYAFIMVQQPDADWAAINAAIRCKWPSKSGLTRIKEAAWKQLEQWQKSSGPTSAPG